MTYSRLFGYKKATRFILIITWVDIITNFLLVWHLNKLTVLALFLDVSWMSIKFLQFMKDPTRFKIVEKVERYTYIQESLILLFVSFRQQCRQLSGRHRIQSPCRFSSLTKYQTAHQHTHRLVDQINPDRPAPNNR